MNNNPTFCYWTRNVKTESTDYHFMSDFLLREGDVVRDNHGELCRIIDIAVEFPREKE